MTEAIWPEPQMTEKQAIAFGNSEAWKTMTDRQIVELQLFTQRLCVPFDRFHQAIEVVLGRGVWTHEFGSAGMPGLQQEFLGNRQPPTMAEIIGMIPEEKRIVVFA